MESISCEPENNYSCTPGYRSSGQDFDINQEDEDYNQTNYFQLVTCEEEEQEEELENKIMLTQ